MGDYVRDNRDEPDLTPAGRPDWHRRRHPGDEGDFLWTIQRRAYTGGRTEDNDLYIHECDVPLVIADELRRLANADGPFEDLGWPACRRLEERAAELEAYAEASRTMSIGKL